MNKQIIILYGNRQNEHLRVEIEGDTICLISHELAVGRIQSTWRDRQMVSMPKSTWVAIAKALL